MYLFAALYLIYVYKKKKYLFLANRIWTDDDRRGSFRLKGGA